MNKIIQNSLVITLALFAFGCERQYNTPIVQSLDENWSFKNLSDSIWKPAEVPGNIHSDLVSNKLIEHPFIGNNEEKLQWISETSWEYQCVFNIDAATRRKKHIQLNFEGLDTYTSVYLNDSLILKSNNAFRNFNVDVKALIKNKNKIRIVFENTSSHEVFEANKLNYKLPESPRVFTRKAQFQYGWDWGPKLNTCGIWRPVTITAWNDFKIKDLYIEQLTLNDSIAELALILDVSSELKKNLSFDVTINDSIHYSFDDFTTNDSGIIPITIKNPKRWWPHNLGDPYLYNFKIIAKHGKTVLDSIQIKKGLRTINLVTEKDSVGQSFYFRVNDVPVYAKGANYIPQNSMQNKVTNEHYKKLIKDVVDANMNMLRVWGGGIYENDIFYDLCDENGILVWQDFMFACAMYPGDKAFLDNVKNEAIDNVKRLRNHSSIALWCGNNENSEGWHRWGWQSNRSDEEKTEIWTNYLKLFDTILPNIVNQYTKTDYWESSPKYGRGNPKYKTEGDAHDWWIWHDAYPFEHLESNVPRFMSEFGFQSLPSYETINFINQSDVLDISSNEFLNHQKHSRGFELIQEYMQRDFVIPENQEDYVYMSQLLQAYGITKGIIAQRIAKPYNMGSLYWQLNDCWPAVSWSSIDYLGNWKALHYKVKRSFENVLITSKLEKNTLKTYLVNDALDVLKGTISIQIMDFEGRIIRESTKDIEVENSASELIHELNLKNAHIKIDEVVIVSTFNKKTYLSYLVRPKDLKLPEKAIQKSITKTDSGFQIELTSNSLQKYVFLFCNERGYFTDNYFDLLPNEVKIIEFRADSKVTPIFNIKSFNSFIR